MSLACSATSLVWLAMWCVSLLGCSDDIVWSDARITLQRPIATACQVDDPSMLVVHALGDFAPSRNTVERVDPRDGAFSIERFPIDTRYLRFESGGAEIEAGAALALRADAAAQTALMLPLGRSCPSPDFDARARTGAAISALSDGSLLIAGGRNDDFGDQSDGAATSTAFLLPAGAELVEQVEGGMFLRRSGASATELGDQVLVIGGGAHDRGPAHDTFEIFDRTSRRFSVSNNELAHGPRRDHAAIALADGSGVLIVGGVSELGEAPLSSAEVVSASGVQSVGALNVAREGASAYALSDGRVLIVGGRDRNRDAVTEVEVFDPISKRFDPIATLEAAERGVSALLIGDRVAWLGCDASACRLSVLQVIDQVQRSAHVAQLPSLSRAQVLGLSDGGVLIVGQRRLNALAEAFRIDLRTGEVMTLSASRAATALHVLSDGTIAELDGMGLSLRRDRVVTPFDNPPATLIAGDHALVFDAITHWTTVATTSTARIDNARIDVAGLIFGDHEVSFFADVPDAEPGNVMLRMSGAGRVVDIRIDSHKIRVGNCEASRSAADGEVTVRRHGNALHILSGDESGDIGDSGVTCNVSLPEHVTLSWLASRGAAIGTLRIQRL